MRMTNYNSADIGYQSYLSESKDIEKHFIVLYFAAIVLYPASMGLSL